MLRPDWLPVVMQGSFSEIYIVDCASFRILHANPAACDNLQYTVAELAAMTPLDLARGTERDAFEHMLTPMAGGRTSYATLETVHTRKDGSAYPITFRILHCPSPDLPAYIMIGNDIAQPAELATQIRSAKETERMRIAREIHDDLGGNLTGIKLAMALLKKRLPPDDTALADKAAYVDTLVDRTIEAIHRITLDLRPEVLDAGLAAAIAWQAREFEKQLGMPCDVTCDEGIELPPDQATAMFRIFQEAVTNIGKHAQATRVEVTLRRSGGSVLLEVVDNGVGIAPTDRLKPASFGIRGMEERAAALGGYLAVTAVAGGGTKVAIRIPSPSEQ